MQPLSNIEATLAERGTRYGVFAEHARITQSIKLAMYDSKNWDHLAADQAECLEMLAHKIGRILNGDPDYHDSWHDIVGYTKLVADRLQQPNPEVDRTCDENHNPKSNDVDAGSASNALLGSD